VNFGVFLEVKFTLQGTHLSLSSREQLMAKTQKIVSTIGKDFYIDTGSVSILAGTM
jgi:hypothetical protein